MPQERVALKPSRKSHQKSRLGCVNCKRRKIKCDEVKPRCSHCSNRGVRCCYSGSDGASGSSASSLNKDAQSLLEEEPKRQKAGRRFIPSRYQFAVSSDGSATDQDLAKSNGSPAELSPAEQASAVLDPANFELWHHYLMSTAGSVGEGKVSLAFWQIQLPNFAFRHPFMLHLLLSLSALHLRRCRPEIQGTCLERAQYHFEVGVRETTAMLLHINKDNCESLFLSAVIVCFCHFGKGPRPGEYIAFSDNGMAPWLVLLKGVRSISESSTSTLHFGILAYAAQDSGQSVYPIEKHDPPPGYKEQLYQLNSLIEDDTLTQRPVIQTCLTAFKSLSHAFRAIYEGVIDEEDESSRYSQIIFAWLYRIEDDFVAGLQNKGPIPLIIFAHYAVLLAELRYQWFMKGWPQHVLRGVRDRLDENHQKWLAWPDAQVHRLSGETDSVPTADPL